MKNIHVLPTEKFSNLILQTTGELRLSELEIRGQVGNGFTQNIYITNDEDIMINDYFIAGVDIYQCLSSAESEDLSIGSYCKKIILTTDQDLIKDGVQEISDEFLEWFVKNPNCEEVDIELEIGSLRWSNSKNTYKIIVPKKEPKQETLEEFIQKQLSLGKYQDQESAIRHSIELGAKWQQEQDKNKYSEEEVIQLLIIKPNLKNDQEVNQWFEKFKKK